MKKKIKNRLYQDGGFPNAISYTELGTLSDNRISYQPKIKYNPEGRPKSIYSKNKLFNKGGSVNISIRSLDQNDMLHPSDSNNLSYRNNPVGLSMTIKKSYCNLCKLQEGGNIAITNDDYKEGLNRGKNIFKFNRGGLKKMTMNPQSGPIDYPINYEGYTDGQLTDQGRAKPGEDFTVNGDTIVETPDLSVMDFDKAFMYANSKKLPIFNWRGHKYPIKRIIKN